MGVEGEETSGEEERTRARKGGCFQMLRGRLRMPEGGGKTQRKERD